jgi:hypothetical protein
MGFDFHVRDGGIKARKVKHANSIAIGERLGFNET